MSTCGVSIVEMRTALPFILILLAVFTAGCIAYIAWELSSDKPKNESSLDPDEASEPNDEI